MYSYQVLFVYIFTILCVNSEEDSSLPMSKEERISLREEARDMFYHAYDAYMDNAFPADELMPLSCRGRWRGVTPNRGDLDDVLGNYSLTLIDSLDSLVVLGDFNEFNRAIKLVIDNVNFDADIVVSVFESNIRILGGLLSAHVLALELRDVVPCLRWYSQELLSMADDLGSRLLPAFNTTTGLPHGRVNLRRGMVGITNNRETCTACAGTIILEFAALSRLTGKPIYEQKASRAMDRLWKTRHRTSELMGTTIDVQSGDWVRKDSGVGAGIDSYYEYCLKAYILLGDNKYLTRFNRHYNAIKKYISRGPLMLAVYMHRPHLQSRNFMDALLAFWPGLQVMMGDLRPAVETHEMLYQVMQRHTFIPEAFTSDFQVHWGQHPLRPEFLESTYFLHRATGDDHYLRVGRSILKSLQMHARVPCGYAAVNDVRTRVHEDRMDSFVLAETLKYLFMLFSEDSDLPINIEKFIMTTEAHFLPLSLGHSNSNSSARIMVMDEDEEDKTRRTCPNMVSLVPKKVREPMRLMVGSTAARPPARLRPLNDPRQVLALADMGISVMTLEDGRVQLLYTTSTLAHEQFGRMMARSPNDAAEGLTFMHEMTRWNSLSDAENGVQSLGIMFSNTLYTAGPAHFGREISGDSIYEGPLALVNPPDACSEITNRDEVVDKFGIAYRGKCTFSQKVWHMQAAGVRLAIIIDNAANSTADSSAIFAMSNDGKEDIDVVIPSAFLYSKEGNILLDALRDNPEIKVTLAEKAQLEKLLSCPDEDCDGNPIGAAERNSMEHLKTVLSQLVAQFELSLNTDDSPKRAYVQAIYPDVTYSKEKFINDKNLASHSGDVAGGSATYLNDKTNYKDLSDEWTVGPRRYIADVHKCDGFDDKETDKNDEDDDGFDEQESNVMSPNNNSFEEMGSEYENVYSDDEPKDTEAENIERIITEEYKNDRFNMEISKIKGIVEFTIEPETNEKPNPAKPKPKKGRKIDIRKMGATPNYPFPPRNMICPVVDMETGEIYVKIGTNNVPLKSEGPRFETENASRGEGNNAAAATDEAPSQQSPEGANDNE